MWNNRNADRRVASRNFDDSLGMRPAHDALLAVVATRAARRAGPEAPIKRRRRGGAAAAHTLEEQLGHGVSGAIFLRPVRERGGV